MSNGWRSITISTLLSWLMKSVLIGVFIYKVYKGDYLFAVGALMAIFISILPGIIEKNYQVNLPFEIDLLMTLALFFHTFLGTVMRFYEKVWLWDKILHVYASAVVAMIGFMAVYLLHYTRKLRLTLPFIGFFTVVFTMAMGVVWEVFEFWVDMLFQKTMQKGLGDTMWDLMYDVFGGVIIAIAGMFYVRYSHPETRRRFATQLGEFVNSRRRRGAKIPKILTHGNSDNRRDV